MVDSTTALDQSVCGTAFVSFRLVLIGNTVVVWIRTQSNINAVVIAFDRFITASPSLIVKPAKQVAA